MADPTALVEAMIAGIQQQTESMKQISEILQHQNVNIGHGCLNFRR